MDPRTIITSTSNPHVKHARALKRRKERLASGQFLVEGLHHVGSVLEAGWAVDIIFYAPELLHGEYADSVLKNAIRIGLSPQPVSAEVMRSLADKDNPQGILAVADQRTTRLEDLQEIHHGVALVSPQDPGNVGAILRTIDAVGADALFLLDGGVELYHPTLIRASMGTIFWKPVVRTSFGEYVSWAKRHQIKLIGTSAHASLDYRKLTIGGSNWTLVLGSEQKGLLPEQVGLCDFNISLPVQGYVSSLNLAVAAGVLLYSIAECW